MSITTEALEQLLAEVRAHDVETGGIFVGLPEEQLITRFIPAGPASRRSQAHFVREASEIQTALDDAEAAGFRYMGEAHAHPGAYDTPSQIDIVTMQRIVKDPDYNTPIALLGIAVRRTVIEGPAAIALRLFRISQDGTFGEIAFAIVPPRIASMTTMPARQSFAEPPGVAMSAALSRRGFLQARRVRAALGKVEGLREPRRRRGDFWAGVAPRQAALLGAEDLRLRRVLLIGAGSIGSQAAALLARSGVGGITVVDEDLVAAVNLGRTTYLASDVGKTKARTLAKSLRAINPAMLATAVKISTRDLTNEELLRLLAAHDVLLDATGSPPSKLRLNALARGRVSAVYAAAYARGAGGEVVAVVPGEGPCLECVVGSVRAGQGERFGAAADYSGTGELHSEPALGIDVAHVAVAAAKMTLALLTRGTGSETEAFYDAKRPILFVGNSPTWIFRYPFDARWAAAGRSERCSCRGGGALETGDGAPAPALADVR